MLKSSKWQMSRTLIHNIEKSQQGFILKSVDTFFLPSAVSGKAAVVRKSAKDLKDILWQQLHRDSFVIIQTEYGRGFCYVHMHKTTFFKRSISAEFLHYDCYWINRSKKS